MREIPVSGGLTAIVDDCDFDKLRVSNWFAVKGKTTTYAHRTAGYRNGKQNFLLMHREILSNPKGIVDHANGNGLDNRRENIRPATNQTNSFNKKKISGCVSRFKGVCFEKNMSRKKRWRSAIRKNGKATFLGFYLTEKEAGEAYDVAAKSMFGEFAKTNEMMGIS